MQELKNSKTFKNIQESLRGESLAIVRYFMYAQTAHEDKRENDALLFERMAKNEIEHAKIWFKYLYGTPTSTSENLKDSAENENSEWKDMYPQFAEVAREEGFNEIAAMFERIASIECDHERRFWEARMNDISENLDEVQGTNETKTSENSDEVFFCIFCGMEANQKLDVCPVCGSSDCFE